MLKTRQVYIISSPLTDQVYIGQTCRTLDQRLGGHKSSSNTTLSKVLIKLGEFKITSLCTIPNCTKQEILNKEKEYIQQYHDKVVNICGIKNRNSKDYIRPDSLDGRYQAHRTIKHTCNICNGVYTNQHKATHFKTKKHIKAERSHMVP